jgi:hypothetical protein
MAIVLVNPGGNLPQGFDEAEGDTFTFAPAPEPGPRHGDGVVILFSSLPAIQDAHPAADVIQGNFIGTDTPGGRDMPGVGVEVSEFVQQLLGGPDTAPGIGAAVSEFVQSNPNETPGVGVEVSEFVHRLLGGPDTTPGGGRVVSDFVHELMEARSADLTATPHSDWLLS